MTIDSRAIAIIFDDHRLFTDSFSALIERLDIFDSVLTFENSESLVHFLIAHHEEPIYLFLDFYLNDRNSLPLINETKRLNKHTRIIMISSVTHPETIRHILRYRPNAFLSKTSGLNTVLSCLSSISKGETYIDPVISDIIAESQDLEKPPFTAREMDMLHHFSEGLTIQETAKKAHLSKHTVIAHRRRMMEKSNSKSITELLAYARKLKII